MRRHLVALVVAVSIVPFVAPLRPRAVEVRPTWILAHRSNDEADVSAAMDKGANGVEFDVVSEGNSFKVRHPGSIDPHIPTLSAYVGALVAERQRLRLAYLDYKGPDFSAAARGRLIAELRAGTLHTSGIRVLLSTASLNNRSLFQGFTAESWIAPQFDEDNTPAAVVSFLSGAGITRAWFADGITELLPEPAHVKANIQAAITFRNAGPPFKGVVVWTLDSQKSMRDYLRLGVDAVLTNRPQDAIAVLKEAEFAANRKVAAKDDMPW